MFQQHPRSVSVIIPAYNVATSVGRSIDSAINQNPAPLEVIVINDGSTDNTERVLRAYGDKIQYLEQENAGQGAARNTGLRHASGRYVAFLDSDDYWLPGFLHACVHFLESHDEAVAVNTASIIKKWGKADTVVPSMPGNGAMAWSKTGTVLDNFFDFWAAHDHVRTGSTLIRRSVIEQAGYQRADLRISQDLEYWGYLATFGRWGFIPKNLFVTDGTPAAAQQGWRNKYAARRRLCPTVEQWQLRIAPRLNDEDWPGFSIVRGRIAAGYAHAKILAGDHSGALHIARTYGSDLNGSHITRFITRAARLGNFAWPLCCSLLRLRETTKSVLVRVTGRMKTTGLRQYK